MQEVTGGYKGLQRFTRGYRVNRGSLSVTGNYRGLKGITKGNNWLTEVTMVTGGYKAVTRGYSWL